MTRFSREEYDASLQRLFVRFPSVQNVGFGSAYKPGLERMAAFDRALGSPSGRFRSLHVAGTNGKGSVASMLASVLSAAGLRTGLYTSPHLEDFRERMRIAEGGVCRMIPPEAVFAFLEEHEAEMDALDLSFFEVTTGMAFRWFADEGVDVAVVEAGLGGRLDSTNILRPDLAVVTSIGLDHCALLGDTLEKIAAEKAGIFKEGVPALVGEALPETRPVFEAKADGFCPLRFAQDAAPSLWADRDRILAEMDLRGAYQEKNLRTALAAVDLLRAQAFYASIPDAAVTDGILHTASRMDFHGRWERLCDAPAVIADIGHNPPALKENAAQLEAMLRSGEATSLIIVYGVMADKDLDGILPLLPRDATYVLTAPHTPRALPAEALAARFESYGEAAGAPSGGCLCVPGVPQAVACALALARQARAADPAARPLVYIGGSTFVVSEAVPYFGR